MLGRRDFLSLVGIGLGAATVDRGLSYGAEGSRPRIAFLGTEVKLHSHAQHFLDRHTMGYAWGGRWTPPRIEVASVFIDQFPEKDLGRGRVERWGLKIYPSVAEALTLGTGKLAVDGVVIIGEHGNYPDNEKGQKLYPRYRWFKEAVKVFEATGRSVPIFNDKHLSTNWQECKEMVEDSKRLQFPFLAGSSLPVTWRLPGIDMPWGVPLRESVCVAYGGVDSYDFHALETAQCMSERRAGGEVGIRSVQALRGEKLWEALQGADREVTRELMVAALSRSHNLPVQDGYPSDPVSFDWIQRTLPDTLGYLIEHRDGFRTTIFLTAIRDFNYAGKRLDTGEVVSCQMYLPMPGQSATTADFFNPLARHIETTILERRAPYPVERTLLTSGMVIAAVDSLFQNGKVIETPEMEVRYSVPNESHFWRE